jgi:predicted peptidase
MNIVLQLAILILITAVPSRAQDNVDGFVGRVHSSGDYVKMPYRLFIPTGYNPAKKYPLILWLHGSGGVGSDNRRQISEASRLGTHIWTSQQNQAKYPAFVLAPQCPTGKTWNSPGQLETVLEILIALQKEFGIDAMRLYIAGQSMGGYGTWELIAKRPNLFAAAIPLCGGGRVQDGPRLVKMPIWAFHGDEDHTVSVYESRKMIDAIKKAGGTPRYTEYVGVEHEVWEVAFKEPGLVEWLFSQHR